MPTRWLSALALILLVGCAGPVGQASNTDAPSSPPSESDEESSPSPTERPTERPTQRPTPTESPREDLVIVDYGFTADSEGDGASYAVIVENPNATWIPNFVSVNITFFDQRGNVLSSEEEILYTVLPGRAAVAGTTFDGRPTEMEVQISRLDESDWQEIDRGSTGHYEFSRVRTVREQYGGHNTTGLISGTFESDQDSVEVTCVFYDSSGTIIGGEFTYVDQVPSGGRASFDMSTFQTFPNLDKTRCFADVGA